jgi:enamine deaminase RidA (YjgF/YER057c/UK114 family)
MVSLLTYDVISMVMVSRQNISSGGKYEKVIGYSRAVKVGNMLFVSGTTGTDTMGSLVSEVDSYAQSKQAILNIQVALEKAGASLSDVVRTRVFVSAKARWQEIGRAHLEFFGSIMPASSMLICSFLDPKILVEIEADAISTQGQDKLGNS